MVTTARLRHSLRQGEVAVVLEALRRMSPARRAERFLQLPSADQRAVLSAAPPDLTAAILADCDSGTLAMRLRETDLAPFAPALCRMPPDTLADLALHLPEEPRRSLLSLLDPGLRDEVQKLMSYDPETAGGLMTTRYLSVPEVVSVSKATSMLRSARLADSPSYVYVVDANGRLAGTVGLRKLLFASGRECVRDLADREVVRLPATDTRDQILEAFREYRYVSLPVVDEKERLIGIVTFDDAMAAMRRREEEIAHGITGVDPREALQATLVAARSRLPRIAVTLAGGLPCTLVSGFFRETLQETVVLGIFIPLVLALSESVGAQTTSIALSRLHSAGERRPAIAAFFFKEIPIAALVGIFSGAATTLASRLWTSEFRFGFHLGVCVFLSMVWAATLGVAIPSLLVRMRADPAIASGPLVLTLSDLSTPAVCLGGAALFLFRSWRGEDPILRGRTAAGCSPSDGSAVHPRAAPGDLNTCCR